MRLTSARCHQRVGSAASPRTSVPLHPPIGRVTDKRTDNEKKQQHYLPLTGEVIEGEKSNYLSRGKIIIRNTKARLSVGIIIGYIVHLQSRCCGDNNETTTMAASVATWNETATVMVLDRFEIQTTVLLLTAL